MLVKLVVQLLLRKVIYGLDVIIGMGLAFVMMYMGIALGVQFYRYEPLAEMQLWRQVVSEVIVLWILGMSFATGLWLAIVEVKKMIRGFEESN